MTAVRRALSIVLLVLVLVAAGVALAAWRGWNGIHQPYKGYDSSEQFVVIRQGAASGVHPRAGRRVGLAPASDRAG